MPMLNQNSKPETRNPKLSGGKAEIRRRHIFLRGVVQGVGFRPFVFNLARRHGLNGWVKNSSEGVHTEVEGFPESVEHFTQEVTRKAPPRARIEFFRWEDRMPTGVEGFEIRESEAEGGLYQLISPDIATCPSCREEIHNPADRRYRYPFTNCTQCGPRFTIIEDIPYDRPQTTMAKFRMCPDCRREYDDPTDRRFHAQPNACPVCGPQLSLVNPEGEPICSADPLGSAIRLLKEGKIVALKGLGGFLLACDARAESPVQALRLRKHRPDKPFAVMLPTLNAVKEHCEVAGEEEALLLSPESPIVLLSWKEDSSIARAVAPRQRYLGILLPYTPLHHLLMEEPGMALVMTSGNLSEEPIAKDNQEALERLRGIADAFLLHDRDIFVQYDDSVTAVVGGRPRVLRRARGYAPFPVRLPFSAKPILACGGELKNTFCVTRDEYAFVSQHIGDMENLETLNHFQRTVEIYRRLFRIQPEVVAYDLHPEYLSTKFALSLPGRKVGIQHHFAHLAGCLAENGEDGPAIGLSFDGLGYGTDGALWGGEFLVGDFRSFRRAAHFEYLPMPGGAAAIRHPWRMALSYVYHLLGKERLMKVLPLFTRAAPSTPPGEEKIRILLRQMDTRMNSPLTSSCGRLFDGISALLGLCPSITFEGQAAMELEMIADREEGRRYEFILEPGGDQEIIRLRPLVEGVLLDLERGTAPSCIAGKFHRTLVEIGKTTCEKIRHQGGPEKVTLSGGVFQNRLLLGQMTTALEGAGFKVLTHRQVPCNDGGLSLGQAVIANFIN